MPPYLGHRGWVDLWLDAAPIDWAEVRELLVESYCLTAPKRLAAARELTAEHRASTLRPVRGQVPAIPTTGLFSGLPPMEP